MRKFYQLERNGPEYCYQYNPTTTTTTGETHNDETTNDEKAKEEGHGGVLDTTTTTKKTKGTSSMMMVPTVYRLVSARCKSPYDMRSPWVLSHSSAQGNKDGGGGGGGGGTSQQIPIITSPGIPIPTELEDRCHIFDTGFSYYSCPVPYHAINKPVLPGMAIPQELEDRCHLVDRTWQALMGGGVSVSDSEDTSSMSDREDWDLID